MFEPHQCHCVVVLEQDTVYPRLVLVQPRQTHPCLTERLLMECKESNQTKQNHVLVKMFIRRYPAMFGLNLYLVSIFGCDLVVSIFTDPICDKNHMVSAGL